MSNGGKQQRPGSTPHRDAAIDREPVGPLRRMPDRAQPLTDPMAYVRHERQEASAQIGRSLKAWRKAGAGALANADAASQGPGAAVSKPGERAEQEADAVAERVASELHGESDADGGAHGLGAKQAAPAIAAKLESGAVARAKKEGAADPQPLKLNPPADRHFIAKINKSSRLADVNTVIASSVDVRADMADIRAGKAKEGKTAGGETEYTVNGRTYGTHPNGTLYPISGAGFFQLDRAGYQLLVEMKAKGGWNADTERFAKGRGVPAAQIELAKAAYGAK